MTIIRQWQQSLTLCTMIGAAKPRREAPRNSHHQHSQAPLGRSTLFLSTSLSAPTASSAPSIRLTCSTVTFAPAAWPPPHGSAKPLPGCHYRDKCCNVLQDTACAPC